MNCSYRHKYLLGYKLFQNLIRNVFFPTTQVQKNGHNSTCSQCYMKLAPLDSAHRAITINPCRKLNFLKIPNGPFSHRQSHLVVVDVHLWSQCGDPSAAFRAQYNRPLDIPKILKATLQILTEGLI